eukprot:3826240-Pleurochrysis_carterae.AAC.1
MRRQDDHSHLQADTCKLTDPNCATRCALTVLLQRKRFLLATARPPSQPSRRFLYADVVCGALARITRAL